MASVMLRILAAFVFASAVVGAAATGVRRTRVHHGSGTRRSSWSLGITGDVNLNPALTPAQRANASFVWGDTIDVTRRVDLMMINHESTFAGIVDKDPATIQFEDPLNYTHAYAAAGIDFISLANNHQYDFGFGGLQKTLASLAGLGVPVAGWPRRGAAAVRRPQVVALPGGGPEVAVFTLVVDECYRWPNGTTYLAGCTCGANADPAATPPYQCYAANDTFPGFWYRFGIDDALIADARSVVAAYKKAHPTQLVVVYLHMGPNFLWQPYAEHEHMLRNISAAGADLVCGARPRTTCSGSRFSKASRSCTGWAISCFATSSACRTGARRTRGRARATGRTCRCSTSSTWSSTTPPRARRRSRSATPRRTAPSTTTTRRSAWRMRRTRRG